jgi:hypothetical protein
MSLPYSGLVEAEHGGNLVARALLQVAQHQDFAVAWPELIECRPHPIPQLGRQQAGAGMLPELASRPAKIAADSSATSQIRCVSRDALRRWVRMW